MSAPLVCWATAGSNDRGPRGLSDEVLALGPLAWGDSVVRKCQGKGFTHVIIAYPGGNLEVDGPIAFDMLKRALQHDDPRVQACGNYLLWGEAAQRIKEALACKVGFYVGTTEGMTLAEAIAEADMMISFWGGDEDFRYADFICIDVLAGRQIGHLDHVVANRLAAAGFKIWSEPRPLRKCPFYPTINLCMASLYHRQGSSLGNAEHLSKEEFEANGATIVLIDDTRVNAETVQLSRAVGIGYAVAPDFVPIVGNHGGPL